MKLRMAFIFLFAAVFTLMSAIVYAGDSGLNSWLGRYTFSEAAPREAGLSDTWVYEIIVYEENDGYFAEINVDGVQTMTRLQARVNGDANVVKFIFDKYLPGHMLATYKEGGELLQLKKSSSSLITSWGEMTPALPEMTAEVMECFVKTADGANLINDYGSLNGVVDEKAFRSILEAWARHCRRLVAEMENGDADAMYWDEESGLNARLSESGHLQQLEEAVRPVLSRFGTGDEEQLTANDRKVLALLKEQSLLPECAEGYGFLVVDHASFSKRIARYLSPALQQYLEVKNSQPTIFFADAACRYSVKEMGGWAVAWERFIIGIENDKCKEKAIEEYQFLMKYILFSELDNSPAFPAFNGGKMEKHWIGDLSAIAAEYPDSRTGAVTADFLKAIKAGGYKLPKAVKTKFQKRVAELFRES